MKVAPAGGAGASRQAMIGSVIKYHESTKHSFSRYAHGPLGLDWANQPNPFRRYDGAHLAPLEHPPPGQDPQPYPDIFRRDSQSPPQPLTKRTLSQLLYDSLALSAWKTTQVSTWPLRVNPSSGNLHPTEGYVISGPVSDVCDSPFVAHYAPKEHGFEIRARLPASAWEDIRSGFPPGSLFIGLSSIMWREAWKYGERAYRYCNHDVGHAVGAVAVSAAILGWRTLLLDSLTSHELELLLGLPPGKSMVKWSSRVVKGRFSDLEQEHPDCLMVVYPPGGGVPPAASWSPSKGLLSELANISWSGNPNSLSGEHVRWELIYHVAEAASKTSRRKEKQKQQDLTPAPSSGSGGGTLELHPFPEVYKSSTARRVVRSRRSAVSMDGRRSMQRDAFYQMLLKSMPALGEQPEQQQQQRQLPFDVLPWDTELHAVLFVHRVEELNEGLYFLVRNPSHEDALRLALRAEFDWKTPPGCPSELPLYLLTPGNCRAIAKRLSCDQDIAGDGCFSLGMIARFEDSIKEHGPWMYPRLFWEAGVLGQLLYLEAHAVGISATGIGCYFDDAVHQLLGITGTKFQSLYHFTVGAPVLDRRIMNLQPYPGPVGDVF